MYFPGLALMATIFYHSIQVKDLIHSAEHLKAPFTQTALQRIKTKRADHTVDVIIFNPSQMTFILREKSCTLGNYTNGLLPEIIVPRGRSSMYGIQSNKYMSNLRCTTRYESADGKFWFSIKSDSSYEFTGSSLCTCNQSSYFSCFTVLRNRETNQARFLIEFDRRRLRLMSGEHLTHMSYDNTSARQMSTRDMMSSHVGGSSLHHKKAKRGRNAFIKALKSGSTVGFI